MLRFHASSVEVYGTGQKDGSIFGPDAGNGFEPITVHFDDEQDHYLQLQQICDSDPDSARVYIEVDVQGTAGCDCFELAEVGASQFRIVFAGEPRLESYGGVLITFDLDRQTYASLRDALKNVFAGFENFRIAEDGT